MYVDGPYSSDFKKFAYKFIKESETNPKAREAVNFIEGLARAYKIDFNEMLFSIVYQDELVKTKAQQWAKQKKGLGPLDLYKRDAP